LKVIFGWALLKDDKTKVFLSSNSKYEVVDI
jgi:hypothetical protein